MKKFMFKKVKGFMVTLELISAILIWSLIMTSATYIVNIQKNQKMMYNAYLSAVTQTSKWGGTSTNIYAANGRGDLDIAYNIESQIETFTGKNIDLTITPTKVTTTNNTIDVDMAWIDQGWFFIPNSRHVLTGSFGSFIKPGSLL